jgi:hypothetical protein
MPNDAPIACTLDAAGLRARTASIDALLDDALLHRREIEGGLRFGFRDAPDVHRRIRELIVAESRCCAFLSFAVGRDRDTVWLDITGAPEARSVIEELFARM